MRRSRWPVRAALCAGLGLAPGLAAQSAVDLEATVLPESVRVGEAFTVRLVVGQERAGEVRFPALIDGPESIEQTGPVQIRSVDEGRRWEAEYTMRAWRADTLVIPPVEVELAAAGGVVRRLQPPAVPVVSVLPASGDPLELREARPLLSLRGLPWWPILLAAALAGLAWWTWGRGRAAATAADVPLGPGDLALRDLARLREGWVRQQVSGDRFYDGYEETLRRYANVTRGWAPSKELFGLGGSDAGLVAALRHSILARFARLRTQWEDPLGDVEVGEAFVRADMAESLPADESGETGAAGEGAAGDGAGGAGPSGIGGGA
ncbi:MAG: protein BatD [Gemmatimonadales bacterium]|nr:protein BatD [Gemmatimonadales bacterium]MYG49631.1 protein BatD [Gemmatimonadales bacterium]MYK01505.1 protein BatD [Candidatus Palauibacter ramosifaciens]